MEIQHSVQLAFSKIIDSLAHIHVTYANAFVGSSACQSMDEFTMILLDMCAASNERSVVVSTVCIAAGSWDSTLLYNDRC